MPATAYVSLAYTPEYVPGAVVLGHRLRELDPARPRVLIVTPGLPEADRAVLAETWTELREFPSVGTDSPRQLAELGRPELQLASTKVQAWRLVEYDQVIYLDADTLPVAPLAELFAPLPRGALIAAAPDIGWPDIFNSGLIVLHPSQAVYDELVATAAAPGASFDGSDQGLLNDYFAGKWHRLPFLFNVTSSASYQYVPAFRRFQNEIRVFHFIGSRKPWHQTAPPAHSNAPHDLMLRAWHEAAAAAGVRVPTPDTRATPADAPAVTPAEVGVPETVPEEEQVVPHFSTEHVIPPAPDRWDPTQFPPPRHSAAEAAKLEENAEEEEEEQAEFQFPELGPSKIKLPWEEFARPAERVFPKRYE